ncbi:hypothetical protein GCM10022222_64490 [Amycolatopsis ultiminotia]|uniref:WXG100 family type VII secretion target n=1 Tax=Amycolatopsis ultiminotia TaxID=543629 RepID=A0ABP6XSU7_9PSEU
MTGGRADLRRADEVLSRVGTTTSAIRAVLTELEATVEQELPGWPSAAKERYWVAKCEWNAAVRRMPECLDRARQAVDEIAAEEPDRAG